MKTVSVPQAFDVVLNVTLGPATLVLFGTLAVILLVIAFKR